MNSQDFAARNRASVLTVQCKGSCSAVSRVKVTPTDGNPALVFFGQKIAMASSERPNSSRWTEIFVYRTRASRYVAIEVGRTSIPRERDYCTAEVCTSELMLTKHLGYTKLSRKIYQQLGISTVEIA